MLPSRYVNLCSILHADRVNPDANLSFLGVT